MGHEKNRAIIKIVDQRHFKNIFQYFHNTLDISILIWYSLYRELACGAFGKL